jgi:hypothetical protein
MYERLSTPSQMFNFRSCRSGKPCTRAPAPPIDWNKKKKRKLEFLDVSFLKSVAPMRSHQKSHVGQPVRIHQSEAAKTRDEANRSYKRVFSHAVDRSLPMKSEDSKPEA